MTIHVAAGTNPDSVAPITYTPTWAGGSPSIGNGTLAARYTLIGKLMRVEIEIIAGSTTNFGSSNWSFSLPAGYTPQPVLADTRQAVGAWWGLQTGVAYWVGTVTFESGSSPYTLALYSNNVASLMGAASPFTWASGDYLSLYASFPVE